MEHQESEEKLSRREMLTGVWSKQDLLPVIARENCTGCGLCALNCHEQALTVRQSDEEDAYQIIFAQALCTACGKCETACPEKCLTLLKMSEEVGKEASRVVFEDELTRCSECGVLLFPTAMVRHLREKTLAAGAMEIPFDLCPECRIKKQVTRGILH